MATTNDRGASDWAPFRCEIVPERELVRVVPYGELDVATVGVVKQHMEDLRASAFPLIVLDLRELRFIDSTGLRFVLAEHARAEREGWSLELIAGPPAVQRLFEVSGFLETLRFRAV